MPRLDILIARNFGISRSAVTRLLRAGAVRAPGGGRLDDGRLQVEPSTLPWPIEVDGTTRQLHARFEVLQHKPLGVVTAQRDDRHPTAYALLSDAPLFRELRSVGRLDLDTSGLLLWTTDGTLLHRLTHPRWGVERCYHAALSAAWRPLPDDLELDDGHRPDIVELTAIAPEQCHPALRPEPDAVAHASITITGGRFHEVRRIFAALGSHVLSLCRVRFGGVTLPPTLAPAQWQPIDLRAHFRGLTPRDVDASDDDPAS